MRQVPRSLLLKQRQRLSQTPGTLFALRDVFSLDPLAKDEPSPAGPVTLAALSTSRAVGDVYNNGGAKALEHAVALCNSKPWRDVAPDEARAMYLHGYGAYGPRAGTSSTSTPSWLRDPLSLSVLVYGAVLAVLGSV